MAVVIETTIGDFTVDLYTDSRPQTCRNFLKLCKIKYYNWNLFFTVQSNFIAQTGDPTATTNGGESVYGIILGKEARYYEAEKMPKIKHDRVGLISMVNCGNNMLGSQFFITLGSELQSLDEHCVFGEITEGLEVVLKFNETICDADHRPYQDIRISHTVILEDPYDDPKGLVIPDRSPEPTKEALMSDRIGADEDIDDTAGMSYEEIEEMRKEKEAKARATILEIVGDIPDADMAPPENVLFVCKLNPVTSDDDLEIIFNRFGKIIGCEVIRDRQTGDSLQYAFIEFADRKSCEEAYFKMDNVLIDDRRIHVDFSQSVAKMRWRGKGKGIKYFDDDEKEGKKEVEKSRDDKKNRNYNRRSRSGSPRRERSRYENRDKYQSKKDDRKKQDYYKNDESKRRGDKEKKSQRRKERSNSNCSKNSDSSDRSRSKSVEKKKSRKEKNRSRSRSTERKKSKKQRSRSRSIENKRNKKERSRSRSVEKSRSRKERSRSREKVRERREKSRERSSDRKNRKSNRDDRSDKCSTSKRRKSRERSEERSEHRRKHKHKSR